MPDKPCDIMLEKEENGLGSAISLTFFPSLKLGKMVVSHTTNMIPTTENETRNATHLLVESGFCLNFSI